MGKQSQPVKQSNRTKILKKNVIPVVLGYANNYQDNYFQGQILTFYLLWHIILCLIVVKLLRTLLSSARLKSYPKRRETKRGELKLIEKIRISLEKSNFIPSNSQRVLLTMITYNCIQPENHNAWASHPSLFRVIPIQDVTGLSSIIKAWLFKGWITLSTG